MECREDRRDVVVMTSAGNQASRRVLYWLKATEVHVGNAGKKWVTVVQATTHKRLDKYQTNGQKTAANRNGPRRLEWMSGKPVTIYR